MTPTGSVGDGTEWMPKRKTIDATTVEAAADEKLVMFGWCSTGHHEGCVVSFTGHRCSCGCHASGKIENHE